MHWLDAISARALARTPPHRRVFRRGWGDSGALEAYLAESAATVPIPSLEITEGAEQTWDGLVGRDLVFESPGRYLPEARRLARARLVAPPGGTGRAVVLMASWNDHGYAGRAKPAAGLAARGITSALLEQPFYGERRAFPGDEQPIATVADFMWMGRSAVLEGRVLADHLRRQGYRVGVSGYSMGGDTGPASSPRRCPSPWPPPCSPPRSRPARPSCTASCGRRSPGRPWGVTLPRCGTVSARCSTAPACSASPPRPTPGRRCWWRRRGTATCPPPPPRPSTATGRDR